MTKQTATVLLLSCSILMACSNLPAVADSDPWAQVKLADIYLNGRGGVPPNPAEAAKLYALAADAGNPYGQARLGALYANGTGVPKDLNKAIELYQAAAKQGNADGMLGLAGLYVKGEGVNKDS